MTMREESGVYFGKCYKLRNTNLPHVKNIVNGNLKEIATEEYERLSEETHYLIDPSKKLLICEYNHAGPRYTAVVGTINYVLEKLQIKEIIYSVISIIGILFIFKFDSQYRLGIIIGFISAFLASTYTILNKKVVSSYDVKTLLLYEMFGASIFFIFCTPIYVSIFSFERLIGTQSDYIYLLLLSSVCTIGLYLLQISVVKVISAFTVNLSYNLEPIYSIILAMIIFKEGKELNFSFYVGLVLIILSVALQTLSSLKAQKHRLS